MAETNIPFAEIVADLGKLAQSGATGAIFVTTNDDRSAQVVFDKGRIVYLYYAHKAGVSALEEMAGIRSGRYRFQPGPSGLPRLELPPNEVILAALLNVATAQALGQSGETSEQQSADTAVPALTSVQRAVLQACLAEFVGPIAAILCDDHIGPAAGLDEVIEALASELPAGQQAQQFKTMVRNKLG